MSIERIRLPLPPSANRYWRQGHNGRVYVSQEAQDYKQLVGLTLAGRDVLDGEIWLDVKIYRKAKRGDIDNYLKVLFDAMQGCVYQNDKQVMSISVLLLDDPKDPRVEVGVGLLPGAGIENVE